MNPRKSDTNAGSGASEAPIPKPGMHLYLPGATPQDENELPTHIAPDEATSSGEVGERGPEEHEPKPPAPSEDAGKKAAATEASETGQPQGEVELSQANPAATVAPVPEGLAQEVADAVLAVEGVVKLYQASALANLFGQEKEEGDYIKLDAKRAECKIRLAINPDRLVKEVLQEVSQRSRACLQQAGWQDPAVEITAVHVVNH
ncbi:MAG: hypothetical protein Q4P06_05975 [Actinomycetaceae bacterium]|nr:hypothetical protein [Actinomycetaceae bacterium]